MGIALLDDEAADTGSARGEIVAHRRPEIVDVEKEPVEIQRSEKRVNRIGNVLESVVVGIGGWRRGGRATDAMLINLSSLLIYCYRM